MLLIAMLSWLLLHVEQPDVALMPACRVLVMVVGRLPMISGRPRRLVPTVVAAGIVLGRSR